MKRKKNNIPVLLLAVRWLFPKLERYAPFLANRIFRLVFYVPLRYKMPEREKVAMKSATLFSIVAAGKKIQCYSWGNLKGPYVLTVHGWAGRATQFRKFIKPLQAAGFAQVGFDGPAHGRSEGRKTTILEFEEALKQIIVELGPPQGVITHSFGGAAVIYAAMNGWPAKRLVNIASPSIANEILHTYLRAINGSWASAEKFKSFVLEKTGRPFEEFTSSFAIQRLPHPIELLIVQDEEDKDVYLLHAEELLKIYPSAKLFKTKGLGHTRILKDDQVIANSVNFLNGPGL